MIDLKIQKELIKQTDELLEWIGIEKSLEDKLKEALNKNLDLFQEKAIVKVLDYINAGEGELSKEEADEIVNILDDILGEDLTKELISVIDKHQVKVYTRAQNSIVAEVKFNQTDYKALNWLKQDQLYWIREHYNKELRADLLDKIKFIVDKGYSRDMAALELRQQFGGRFQEDLSYWSNLANHITTRARQFGKVEGYVKAEITHLKVVAVLDHRTSEICRYMHGKIIKVKLAVDLRDKLMNAKDKESVKKIAPWLKQKEIESLKKKNKIGVGLALPPYHWGCRTDTVIAYENEIKEYEQNNAKSDFIWIDLS